YSDDAKARALWMWHMLEESEHKDVAYDVYQVLSGNYALRISGFALAFITILGGVSLGALALPFLHKPRNLVSLGFWKEAKTSASLLFGTKKGVFGSTMGHIFDYLRPDFHPNDHDTTAYLSYYKEKLFNPENGALTPFFVKEFTPAVRAA
ncbi:MAG TPA: metal-dependent hydrolase, partial [Agitococcus sp.]|nr:metal-dependent hydrolase [Agitococcus sp.]